MKKKTLEECFYQIRNGANIKQGVLDGGYPITRIETTSDGRFNRSKMGYAGIIDLSKYESYVLEDGDLLMSHINSIQYLGRTVLYKKKDAEEKIIHGMNLLSLKANKDVIKPEYARYYFCSSSFKKQITRIAKKSVNQASFTVADLKKLVVDVPSLSEQMKIAEILDCVNEVIFTRRQELQKLDDLVKARFVELFGDPVLNPFSWEMKRFDEICENLDSRRKPISSGDRVEGIYPYYGASGIVDYVEDYIFDEDILLVSEDGANLLMRSTPIAFSVSGKVWVNNHAHVVRFDKMSLQKYVEIYFSLIDISDSITGSAQPKLNQAKLNAMMIPIPEDTLLDRYCEFLYQVDKSKVAVQKSLDKLQILFDKLMQEYFK